MTATFLQNELQSLIQESKRKSPETRTAAEKSLADLKNLSVTSESQLSGDLVRKPQFVDPFVFACRSRNVKLAAVAVNCLQRLAAGRAIPRERLSDVLDALREIAALSLDVQLKTLQTLPPLLQLYSNDIRDSLLAVSLEICDTLQASKTAVVSSTAEATFQQLVTTVYDRVPKEDSQPSENGLQSIQVESKTFSVRPAAHDAYRIFDDLCALADGTEPTFVQLRTLSPHFLLEVVGSIVTNYNSIILQHPEQLEVCRSSLLPSLNKILAAKSTFAVTLRALRIIYVLIRHHLRDMVIEIEDGLMLMIGFLEPNAGQSWRRILCLEVFRGVCSDAPLFRDLYRLYDDVDARKNVIGTLLAAFVRIASEDPTLIGLGRQSTMPFQQGDTASQDGTTTFEASDIGGAVGGVVSASATVTGLSTEWSTVKVPCLEQLDKRNLTDIPTTYVYNLVLNCISALAEGMSRFVMPLSVPNKSYTQNPKLSKTGSNSTTSEGGRPVPKRSDTANGHHQSRLINPLAIDSHPQLEALSSCARMLDNCWPPILATCSTFFNAALDAEYYHNLVRAFQKLTQVSGVLELATARDALLTSLSKAAVPSSTNTRLFSPSVQQNAAQSELLAMDATPFQSTQSAVPKDIGQPRLSVRNLLCLRALLNLGIALGPSLGTEAWFIILETLERAETLISLTRTRNDDVLSEERPSEQGDIRTLFGVEAAAVQTATKRMFESTGNYTDDAFIVFVTSLFKLDPGQDTNVASDGPLSPISPVSTQMKPGLHRANRSVSGLLINSGGVAGDQAFVIYKTAELSRINLHRFMSLDSMACSWQLLTRKFLDIFASQASTNANRIKSAEDMNNIILQIVKNLNQEDEKVDADAKGTILKRCFDVFLAQLQTIEDDTQSSDADIDLRHKSHAQLLATLESVVGHCGDVLTYEWTDVLRLISSSFQPDDAADTNETVDVLEGARAFPRSEAILQRAFACVQLIVSDFLSTLNSSNLTDLTVLLLSFGSQTMALNISLTTTTFGWNIATLLLDNMQSTANKEDGSSISETPNKKLADARKTWMLLFSHMSLLGLDDRSDVRQSSVRMTTKVLEAASDQLSPSAWNICLQRFLSICSTQVKKFEDAEDDGRTSWQEAASQTLSATIDIAVANAQEIGEAPAFAETWTRLLRLSSLMLGQKTLPMSNVVFRSLATMLRSLEPLDLENSSAKSESVLEICLDHHPADVDVGRDSNQAALTQFAASLASCLSSRRGVNPDVPKMIVAVERTVLECIHPPYTSDTKTLAPEQEAVVALLPQLHPLLTRSAHIELLLTFIKAPLARSGSRTNATFVALASRSSEILRETFAATSRESIEVDSVSSMLKSLNELIATKYTSQPQGGTTPLWSNATTSAVQITQSVMSSELHGADVSTLTAALTAVAASILQPGGLTRDHGQDLTSDELFDISSFHALHTAVVPKIGSDLAPTALLKSYILTLFRASLVAEPFLFDLPDGLVDAPLKDLSVIRPGTVCDPVYAQRNRICYTALDALSDLVAKADSKDQRTARLAQIAAPYFLLRCAYTFKTFIADQPLRSISALPQLLRVELLTILNKCVFLHCDPQTFTGISRDDNGDGKAHLRLLNGLVVRLEECWRHLPRKGTGVNWQDRKDGKEIEEALAQWKACLSEGWDMLA